MPLRDQKPHDRRHFELHEGRGREEVHRARSPEGTGRIRDFDPATYGDRIGNVYDDWFGTPEDAEATAALLSELADSGPALELGIGTGRVAIPLSQKGIEVHGIDASGAMVERLREKPGGTFQ